MLEPGASSTVSVAERRRRGEISCAECRRLKMRCDKNVPCKSCIRRGCGHLCPNGTNVTADGPRLVLAATKDLHESIAALRDRTRVLEKALGPMHRDRTGSAHPLLRPQSEDEWEDDEFRGIDSLAVLDKRIVSDDSGILAASTDGTIRFFGSQGGALVHVMSVASEQPAQVGEQRPDYDVELTRCIRHFPFEPTPAPDHEYILRLLRTYIPSREIYDPLLDTVYAECGNTYFSAFRPDYVDQSLIPAALYGEGRHGLHALGSFFALLAVGCLFAVHGPGEAHEVKHFALLSAGALGAGCMLAHPTLELIEGLYARAVLEFFRQTAQEESARSTLTLACEMCYDLGLHMDGAHWRKCTAEELHRRKSVFWMLFLTDTFESILTGRPARMAFDLAYIDVEMPRMPTTSKLGNVYDEMARMAMLYAEISCAIQSLKPPTYSRILDLDEKARAIFTSPDLLTAKPTMIPPSTMINIYLHRAFFARALTEHPNDPLESEYSLSVHAAFRGARETFVWLGTFLEAHPASFAQRYYVWSIALAAATIYITLLERAPYCPQAKNIKSQLDNIIPLFVVGAKYGSLRAKHSLHVLCTRMKKIPDPIQDVAPDIQSYLSASLHPKSELSPAVQSDQGDIVPPSNNPVTESFASPLFPIQTLRRSVSLSSVAEQPTSKAAQSSHAMDDSFYPSYLQRRPFVPTSRSSNSVKEFDVLSSVPLHRSLGRRAPPALLGYESTINAALWEGMGWEAMQQAPLKNSSPEDDGPSPGHSLTCEWNTISLGGG